MKICKTRCKHCLLSGEAIVPARRRADLIADIARRRQYFACHEGTLVGDDVMCRGWLDFVEAHPQFSPQMLRIARRLGVVSEVTLPEAEVMSDPGRGPALSVSDVLALANGGDDAR